MIVIALIVLILLNNDKYILQIHTYVNGIFYSLLTRTSIHKTAVTLDLKQKLLEFSQKYNQNENFQQQISYLLQQLENTSNDQSNTNTIDEDEENDDDFSEEEDFEEYDEDELYQLLLKEENNQNLQGDKLLLNDYSMIINHKEKIEKQSNTITPVKIVEKEWHKNDDYQKVFGKKERLARTPPLHATRY